MSYINEAIARIEKGSCNLAAISDKGVFTFNTHGITSILQKLKEDPSFWHNASVADTVIGKAAALLFVYGQVKEIYAKLISRPALSVFETAKIEVTYKELTAFIKNRSKDGLCPMEQAVINVDDPKLAYILFADK